MTSRWFYPALFLGIFVLLLFLRSEVLYDPPYWDSILGLYTEAIWLYQNHFDYLRLAFEEPGYSHDGARHLYFTVYPAFQALLMGWFETAESFLLFNHLLNFGYAASALVLFYRLLIPSTGPWVALTGAATLLSHPLFLSQTDAIGYEMAVLACTMLAFDRTLSGRPVAGALLALLAMHIKPTGVIGVAALLLYHAAGPDTAQKDTRRTLVWLGAGLVAGVAEWLIRDAFYLEGSDTIVVFLRGSIKRLVLEFPDLLILFVLAGAFVTWTVRRWWLSRRGGQTPPPAAHRMAACFLVTYLGFYIHIIPMLPRYFLYALPFLLFPATVAIRRAVSRPAHAMAALVVIAAVFLGNLHGRYYAAVPTNDGFLLERSLEYRDDMRLNISLVKRLAARYYDVAIVTSAPYVQMLAMPELGYVKRPLAAVKMDGPLRRGEAAYQAALATAVRDTVWLYGPNCFSSRYAYYQHEDRILETISDGHRRIILFDNIE